MSNGIFCGIEFRFRFLFSPDDEGGISAVNPTVNAEEGEEGKEFVKIADQEEEEIIYVADESQIPKDEPEVPAEPEKPSIEDVIAKQGEAQTKTLQDLGQMLAKNQSASVVPSGPPPVSEEEFKEKYTKLIYKDPIKAREMYDQRRVIPAFNQMMQKNADLEFKYAKVDPATKELFDDYGDEINEAYGRLSAQEKSNPQGLKGVLNDVRNNHFKDTAKKYAQEMFDEMMEKTNKEVPAQPSAKNTTFVSGGGVQSARSTSGKKAVYKVKAPNWVAQEAARTGFSGTAEQYLEFLQEYQPHRLKK